jgi:hypothetical protein
MNIESILSKMILFEELVIDSGLKRDLVDYIGAIAQSQNRNLIFMKDVSEKVKTYFFVIENNSLASELKHILKDSEPFTSLDIINQIDEINSDPVLTAEEYFQKFYTLLEKLNLRIDENLNEIKVAEKIFNKYITSDNLAEGQAEQALVSLVFKDLQSTGSLKEFSKALNRWNRTLLIYHTLLKSKSPEEISLVEIQNGSIDVIFNIDFDIAIDLTELITFGLKAYGAYLLLKSKVAKEFLSTYIGNKKLLKLEEDREILMLDNIKESIKTKALEQHKRKLKEDNAIEKTGVEKKIDEISNVITDHIIKGNEIKLLNAHEEVIEDGEEKISLVLRQETAIVRERFKQLDDANKQLLLDKFTIKDEEPGK